jgi:hypothetical protein
MGRIKAPHLAHGNRLELVKLPYNLLFGRWIQRKPTQGGSSVLDTLRTLSAEWHRPVAPILSARAELMVAPLTEE